MSFRNPVTHLPASGITGQIDPATQVAAGVFPGGVIAKSLKTATSGQRVEVTNTSFDRVRFFTGSPTEVNPSELIGGSSPTLAVYSGNDSFGTLYAYRSRLLIQPVDSSEVVAGLVLLPGSTSVPGRALAVYPHKMTYGDGYGSGGTDFLTVSENGAASSFNRANTAFTSTSETTTSLTFTDLATVGPDVTLTVPESGRLVAVWSCQLSNNTAGAVSAMGLDVFDVTASASISAASDSQAIMNTGTEVRQYSMTCVYQGLTPGNSVRLRGKYRVSGGTGTFLRRRVSAWGSM